MNRLTEYILGFAHGKKGSRLDLAEKSKTLHRGCFECSALIDRLAEYEDTGLCPQEVNELKQKLKNEIKLSVIARERCAKLAGLTPECSTYYCIAVLKEKICRLEQRIEELERQLAY